MGNIPKCTVSSISIAETKERGAPSMPTAASKRAAILVGVIRSP
jgi:hypothetical protein